MKKTLDSLSFIKTAKEKTVLISKKFKIPGLKGLTLYDISSFIYNLIKKGNLNIKSAAISFDFFIALFPAIIFFLTLIPFIPVSDFQDRLFHKLSIILPENVFSLLEIAFDDLVHLKYHALLSVGFLLSIYFASKSIDTILTVFNDSHQKKIHPNPYKQRFLSLVLFVKIISLLILSIFISFYSDSLIYDLYINDSHLIFTLLLHIFKWVTIFYLLIYSLSILYNYGNTHQRKFNIINAGSLFATLTILLASKILSFFFENLSNYNEIYGSLSAILITFIWIKTLSYILIIGFELYTAKELHKQKNQHINK